MNALKTLYQSSGKINFNIRIRRCIRFLCGRNINNWIRFSTVSKIHINVVTDVIVYNVSLALLAITDFYHTDSFGFYGALGLEEAFLLFGFFEGRASSLFRRLFLFGLLLDFWNG